MNVVGNMRLQILADGRFMLVSLPLENGDAADLELTPETAVQLIGTLIAMSQKAAEMRGEAGLTPQEFVISPLQALDVHMGEGAHGAALVVDFGGVYLPISFSPAQFDKLPGLLAAIRSRSPAAT